RGFMQRHGINLAGGNSYTRYNISISAFNQDGTIINSGFDRYQGRLALDQQISPKLKSSLKINYSSQKDFGQIATTVGDNAQTTALMYAVWGYRPISASLNPDLENENFDELDGPNDNRVNPIIATKNTLRQRRTLTLNANVNLVYDVLRDLQFKITAGINARSIYNDAFYNSRTAQGNLKAPTNTKGVNGSTGFVDRQDWVNENTLSYNKLFSAKHKLNIVAGFTLQGIKSSAYGYASQRITDENVGIDGLATGNIYSINALETRNSLMSFLGRATYTFNRKYVLTSTLRADGSSKFSKGNRWGYFPSAAFAWNISDEKWMKKITPVSSAKLRVSYGLIGNNRVGDFDYLQQIAQTTAASYSFNDIPYYGAVPTNLGNSNLKWETTAQLDIGLDISFFNNRIEIIGDFYRKTTKDLLLNTNLRPSTGFSTTLANVGRIQNQGLELTLNTQNIKGKHFSWASSFNISFNENKLLALANGEINMFSAVRWYAAYNASYLYLASVGAPAAQFYGYLFDGIYQLDDFEQSTGTTYRLKPSLPSIGGDPSLVSPGDMKYKDINGDGTIDENDMAVMGRAIPIHSGGFNNTFNYKNFGLSVFFQWSYGNNIYNTNRMMFEANQYNKYAMNQYATYVDRWTPTNPSNKLPRAKARNFVGAYTSRVLEDGSYLRLKTVAFNYNFSSRFAGKIGVKKLMATAAGQNLLTWTKYSGMDPEVSVSNSILTPGFDFSAYPRGRVLTLGLQATL
ncbi:SusC/RagA family TonB-linked outer membrane protein, partial [Pedobacter sp.]